MTFFLNIARERDAQPAASSSDVDSQVSRQQDEKSGQAPLQSSLDIAAEESLDQNAQAGVQRMQALATVWSKSNLITAYTIIWLVYVVTSLEEVIVRALNPYVTSDFRLHSLTAASGIMSNIIGGLTKIPIAKILDTWGRPQGLALTLLICVVGFVMMAACGNVETYAAAQVFSSIR